MTTFLAHNGDVRLAGDDFGGPSVVRGDSGGSAEAGDFGGPAEFRCDLGGSAEICGEVGGRGEARGDVGGPAGARGDQGGPLGARGDVGGRAEARGDLEGLAGARGVRGGSAGARGDVGGSDEVRGEVGGSAGARGDVGSPAEARRDLGGGRAGSGSGLAGSSGGDPLLLLMGLGVSRFWWPDGLVAAFIAAGFHVASFDGRDAGGSTHFGPHPGSAALDRAARPGPVRADEVQATNPVSGLLRRRPPAYTAEDQADDTVAVLDALGWQRAHLFGISQGGLVAQRTALRHPHRVHTLTTFAAVPSDVRGAAVFRYVRLPFLARLTGMRHPTGRAGDVAAGLALARAVASPGYPFDEAEARLRVERELDAGLPSGVRDSQAQARQVSAPWHGPRLRELTVPTLVLHGEQDPLIRPAAGRRIAASVAKARYVELPGVGHDLPRDIWPTLVDEIRRHAG